VAQQRRMGVCPENRTQMTQKKLIFADEKDKIRMICENLWASDASAFCFSSAVVLVCQHGRLFRK